MPWAAAAVAGAGLIGGVMQSQAAGAANDKSIQAQREAAAQQRADLQPWAATGGVGNTATTDLLGLNGQAAADAAMGKFQQSPGYQFQLGEGLRAVDAGAAGQGILRSGATLKAEQAYGSGLANKEFGDYYNRLFDLSKLGESAAAGQGAGGLASANQQSASATALGAQQASIYGNAAAGIGSAVNNYQQNSLYADRTKQMGGGFTDTTSTF